MLHADDGAGHPTFFRFNRHLRVRHEATRVATECAERLLSDPGARHLGVCHHEGPGCECRPHLLHGVIGKLQILCIVKICGGVNAAPNDRGLHRIQVDVPMFQLRLNQRHGLPLNVLRLDMFQFDFHAVLLSRFLLYASMPPCRFCSSRAFLFISLFSGSLVPTFPPRHGPWSHDHRDAFPFPYG